MGWVAKLGHHPQAGFEVLLFLQDAERAAAKERKEREEREQAAHKKLARDTEEAERRRRRAAAADAAGNYRTLLSESVKDPEASWADWRLRLAKDPQVSFPVQAPPCHNKATDSQWKA